MFATEVALCASFLEWLKAFADWTPYAETEGWDILLVHADGTQIGVQAKLRFNMDVLHQAVESGYGWNETGPDYRAVLVPEDSGGRNLCDALGLTLIRPRKMYGDRIEFSPDFSDRSHERWHYQNPGKRCPLPSYVPDVPAGASGPVALTRWKVGALQISAIIEIRGWVTRTDFRVAGIDHRRWIETWLEPVPDQPGRWRWRDGKCESFSAQHPTVYPRVLADIRERALA